MFRSSAVAYVNPSSSCKTVLILGIGNGFLTIRLFTSLKSLMNHTVWFYFGTMNEGEAHSDSGCHFSTPNSHSLCTSFFRVSLWAFGVGKGLPWYGFAPSFSLRETVSVSQSPSVPSKRSSNSVRSFSNFSWSGTLRCLQFSVTTALRSAFSYLASKILTTRHVASRVLLGSWVMTLLFAIHALSILALVESLVPYLCFRLLFTWQLWHFLTCDRTVLCIPFQYIALRRVSARCIDPRCCR